MDLKSIQIEVCLKYAVVPFATPEFLKVGISQTMLDGALPLNGVRYLPEGDTSGWYLWAGEELSQDDDFFMPMHIHHLIKWVPDVMKYLLLPPTWRFLVMPPDYEDVWQDTDLVIR